MSLSLEPVLGGGRSLLQSRGGYRDRYRERERQQKVKAGIYAPVEFKVFYCPIKAVPGHHKSNVSIHHHNTTTLKVKQNNYMIKNIKQTFTAL